MNITHVEFGIYLVAIGTEMRKRNISFGDAIDPPTPEQKEKIRASMLSQGMSSARVQDIEDRCWAGLRCVSMRTYGSRGLAAQADAAASLPDEGEDE